MPPQGATIDEFIDYFARVYAQVTGGEALTMKRILCDARAHPRSVFEYLDELRAKGAIASEEFDAALDEFWWRFC